MLEAKSLWKATAPSYLLPYPSPGSLQPTRLALFVDDDPSHSSCFAYFASGSHVYKSQISTAESLVHKGKDSLLIPAHAEVIEASVTQHFPHQSEIQSIELTKMGSTGSSIIGSVDAFGHLIVSELDADNKDIQKLSFTASPQDCVVGEGSWAGLSFSPSQCSMVAVAHSFPKCINIYDQGIHLRNLHTLYYPTSLTFVQSQYGTDSSILAVTEGSQLSMWDLRVKENGGCLKRISGSPGDTLYAASISSTGNIAIGGADRTVTIYDPRRWRAISRWINCSKYEITGLAFSSIHPDYIYIQGVDCEVFCGEWSKDTKIFSFRGDSNWLGFTKCPNKDILGGWCDSGSIFLVDIAASIC